MYLFIKKRTKLYVFQNYKKIENKIPSVKN